MALRVAEFAVVLEVGRVAMSDSAANLMHSSAMRDTSAATAMTGRQPPRRSPGGVLLDQYDRRALGVDRGDDFADLVDEVRRQPEGRLIEEEELGLGHR